MCVLLLLTGIVTTHFTCHALSTTLVRSLKHIDIDFDVKVMFKIYQYYLREYYIKFRNLIDKCYSYN